MQQLSQEYSIGRNLPPTSLSPAEDMSLGEGARSEPVSVAPLLCLNRSGEGSQDLLSDAIVVEYDRRSRCDG